MTESIITMKKNQHLFKERIKKSDYAALIQQLSEGIDSDKAKLKELLFGTDTPEEYSAHGKYTHDQHMHCSGLKGDAFGEKRLCKCMYYNNSSYPKKCESCDVERRYKVIGQYQITDYEVPAFYYGDGIGEIDLILTDTETGTEYAAEVKPYKNNSETLLRMAAEIITYTEGYPEEKYKKAIAFFEKNREDGEITPQQGEYESIDPTLADLLKKADITVFRFEEVDSSTYRINKLQSGGETTHTPRRRGTSLDGYTRALLSLLKKSFEEVVGKREFQNGSEARSYYLKKLDDNLYRPMDNVAIDSYGRGTGNEIASGKMNALRSSSALTYNLFWNRTAKIAKPQDSHNHIGDGVYSVEFEKQYPTLSPSVAGLPANLDAFLYCEDTREAIACEMKMMEWIFNKPGNLKNKYLIPENYINEEAGEVFVAIAKELILKNDYDDADILQSEYPCRMTRYDAFQMFKHTVACYSACAYKEQRKIEKLTLVNCAWTLSDPQRLEPKYRERYLREEECELYEFDDFKQIMQPAKTLFADLGVDFDIQFYALNDFLALLDKDAEELDYLRRYTQ